MVLLVLVIGAGGAFIYIKFDRNITAVPLISANRPAKPAQDPQGNTPLNILLMGSDTRAGADHAYGANDHAPLSDSTMLLHVDAERTSAYVVSIPRDTMISRPSCPGLKGGTAPAADPVMFNTALGVGGPACTVHTVENMTGLYIDHFIEVDFEGFKRMVDAVDGVDVCLPNNVADYHSKLYLSKGRHHIDGAQALAFARERYDVGDGSDLGRIKLQQQLVGSLLTKVHSDGVLFNPAKLYILGDTATKSITTDTGLSSVSDLLSLAKDLRSIPPSKITFLTMPNEAYVADPNRLQMAEPAASQLWAALKNDTLGNTSPTPSPSASTPSPAASTPSVPPSTISLVVLNGTLTTDKATSTASSLKGLGYQIAYVGNAATRAHSSTTVEYPASLAAAARSVHEQIPGSTLMQVAGLTHVTLVIGQQFALSGSGTSASPTPSTAAIPSSIPTRVATTDVCKAS